MRTITFYSYKGGAGRTLALANVAWLLAKQGRRVFVLDCDLEAPGLHYKFFPDEQRREEMKPGFVDYSYEYFQRDGFRPIMEYVEEIPADPGKILLMAAGRPLWAEYWTRLVKINWPDQFYEREGEGFLFLLELKRIIETECRPDFLLIDARTGVTEVGGVALTLLPDQVVLLFVNNDESKEGTREILRSIPRTLPEGDKLPAIVPVLARVPEDEPVPTERFRAYLSEPAPDDVTLPPIERVLVLHSDRELERKEALYLGSLDKRSRLLYRDYFELFRALSLVDKEELASIEVRALAQEAAKAAEQRDLSVAVRLRRQALDAAATSFGPKHARYVEAMRDLSSALLAAGDDEEALRLLHDIKGLYAELGVADAATLGPLAHDIALLSARMTKFSDVPDALATALQHAQEGAFPATDMVRSLDEIRERYKGSSARHDTLAAVMQLLSLGYRLAHRDREADEVLADVPRAEPPSVVAPRLLQPPAELPTRRARHVRGGSEVASFLVHLSVVTPILGGAVRTRTIDTVDVIRVPSLRGQLRFWWRALYGGQLQGESLYAAERRLWGGAADEHGGRSDVEIRVTVEEEGREDESPIRLYGRDATPGAYALWPARETRGKNREPTAPRRAPGTRFTLDVHCPKRDEPAVRNTVRALILFGGYGGRTRRGTGSFTVERTADRAAWLPAEASRAALTALFGEDVLAALPDRRQDDLPLLRGAGLRAGRPVAEASMAWTAALEWLSRFRQDQPHTGVLGSHDAAYARDRGDARRPGRSNWPEADKVRRLSGRGPWAHEPQHNDRPAWPRSGFGLPIVAQFQRKDRNDARYREREPEDYELRWHEERHEAGRDQLIEHDRLASPLIVKALPLADGRFVPCALWLYRGYPKGEVGLKAGDPRFKGSRGKFDVLVAEGDKALFAPLDHAKDAPQGTRLRSAFFAWLERHCPGVVVVAP